jgi:gamma-glutamylcyclotransferase
MFYFAYGSNMNWGQMRARCPAARFFATASLSDHRLAFPRYSRFRRCDVASIVPAVGEVVWGVVYRIDEADRCALDVLEGFEPERDSALNSYEPIKIAVLKLGQAREPLDQFTYIARPQRSFTPRGPSEEYRALILSGARHWGHPADYLRNLEAVRTLEPNSHTQHGVGGTPKERTSGILPRWRNPLAQLPRARS